MFYTVLNLESNALLVYLLSNIPSSARFPFHPPIFFTIFTHKPFSPSSLVYPYGNTNSHLSSSLTLIHHLFIHLFFAHFIASLSLLFHSLHSHSDPNTFPYMPLPPFHPSSILIFISSLTSVPMLLFPVSFIVC